MTSSALSAVGEWSASFVYRRASSINRFVNIVFAINVLFANIVLSIAKCFPNLLAHFDEVNKFFTHLNAYNSGDKKSETKKHRFWTKINYLIIWQTL